MPTTTLAFDRTNAAVGPNLASGSEGLPIAKREVLAHGALHALGHGAPMVSSSKNGPPGPGPTMSLSASNGRGQLGQTAGSKANQTPNAAGAKADGPGAMMGRPADAPSRQLSPGRCAVPAAADSAFQTREQTREMAGDTEYEQLVADHLVGGHGQRSNTKRGVADKAAYHETWLGRLENGAREGAWGMFSMVTAVRCAPACAAPAACASCENNKRENEDCADLNEMPASMLPAREEERLDFSALPAAAKAVHAQLPRKQG